MTIFAYMKYVTAPFLSAPPPRPWPTPVCPRFHPVKRNFVASSGVRLCYWKDNFAYNRQGPCIMRGQLKNSTDFRPHNCCEPTCSPYSNKKFQPVGGREWCSEPFDFKLVKGRGPDKTFFFRFPGKFRQLTRYKCLVTFSGNVLCAFFMNNSIY